MWPDGSSLVGEPGEPLHGHGREWPRGDGAESMNVLCAVWSRVGPRSINGRESGSGWRFASSAKQWRVMCARESVTVTSTDLAACTRTTITMRPSSGSARKRALSDPEVPDVRESDRKKAKNTYVDPGHPILMAQHHGPIRSVSSLLPSQYG